MCHSLRFAPPTYSRFLFLLCWWFPLTMRHTLLLHLGYKCPSLLSPLFLNPTWPRRANPLSSTYRFPPSIFLCGTIYGWALALFYRTGAPPFSVGCPAFIYPSNLAQCTCAFCPTMSAHTRTLCHWSPRTQTPQLNALLCYTPIIVWSCLGTRDQMKICDLATYLSFGWFAHPPAHTTMLISTFHWRAALAHTLLLHLPDFASFTFGYLILIILAMVSIIISR